MFFKNISQSLLRIEELLRHFIKRPESFDAYTRPLDLPCEVKVQSFISKYEVSIDNTFYDFSIYQGLNGKLYCSLPSTNPSVASLYDSVRSDVGIVDRFACSFRFSLVPECGKEELLSKAILYFIKVLNATREQNVPNGLNR